MNTKTLREVEKYRDIPGSVLLGWRLVGLPVYKLQVGVLAIEPKPIEPVDEFILRTLNLGINSFNDVTSFLGLDAVTVHNHLADLHRTDLIKVEQNDSDSIVSLTPKGKSVSRELKANQIVELTIPVLYDGICRMPLDFDLDLLNDHQISELDAVPVPPSPSRRPSIDQLKLDQLKPKAYKFWRKKLKEEEVPEIIGVKRIAKERFGMFYRLATMLIYQSEADVTALHYSFIVNGVKEDGIGDAFDKKGLNKNLPLELELNPVSVAQTAKKYIPDYLEYNLDEVIEASQITSQIEENLEQKQAILNDVLDVEDSDTKQRQADEIVRLEQKLRTLEEQQKQTLIVPLLTSGIIRVLDDAIKSAQERLVIVSGTISDYAVEKIEPGLTKLVERGVEVWLGYGMGGKDRQSRSQRSRETFHPAVERLKRIQKINPEKVKLLDLGNSHMKILLCDRQFVVSGSLNYLSHRPSGKNVMAEHAYKISVEKTIEQCHLECEKIFANC